MFHFPSTPEDNQTFEISDMLESHVARAELATFSKMLFSSTKITTVLKHEHPLLTKIRWFAVSLTTNISPFLEQATPLGLFNFPEKKVS